MFQTQNSFIFHRLQNGKAWLKVEEGRYLGGSYASIVNQNKNLYWLTNYNCTEGKKINAPWLSENNFSDTRCTYVYSILISSQDIVSSQ